ncbi:MAG: hypothetical protein ACFFDN_06795 [Candidatus Hodarchaeota archaeon]
MPIGSLYIAHLIIGIFAILMLSIVFFILIYSYIKSKNTSTLLFASFFALNAFWAFGSTFYPILERTYAYALAVAAISSCYLGFYENTLENIRFASLYIILLLIAIFFGILITIFIREKINNEKESIHPQYKG